jgi:hypothetical protein
MNLQLYFQSNRHHYRPGEWLDGGANWNLSIVPHSIEFRLLWFTRGKGNRDMQVVATLPLRTTSSMGSAPFRFQLPNAPHSFSGTLSSLVWAVEAVVLPGETSTRLEFVLSPTGSEIVLPRID